MNSRSTVCLGERIKMAAAWFDADVNVEDAFGGIVALVLFDRLACSLIVQLELETSLVVWRRSNDLIHASNNESADSTCDLLIVDTFEGMFLKAINVELMVSLNSSRHEQY